MKYYATTEGGYADRYVDQGNEFLGKPPADFSMYQLGKLQYTEILQSEMGIDILRVYEHGETVTVLHHDYLETSETAIALK